MLHVEFTQFMVVEKNVFLPTLKVSRLYKRKFFLLGVLVYTSFRREE